MSPIFKVSNYVDAYRLKAKYSRDLHQLDGRRGYVKLTEFTNQQIWDGIDPDCEDSLVDIGCGDGCLLVMAREKGIKNVIGLSGSEEEAERLRAAGFNVLQGLTNSLPLPDEIATVVVCNAVLLLVPREKIASSLDEIARISRKGARIWIGEIPSAPEQADVPRHTSVSALLGYLLRVRGPRTFFGMVRLIVSAILRGEPFILNGAPLTVFYSAPEEFIAMATSAGLELKRYLRHKDIDSRGNVRTTEVRYNYIFAKP